MFGIVFGWRKASKCKKLIRRALSRLKVLKKKRYSIVRQLREDLVELINNGYQQIAFNRVEQLIKDENVMAAYDLIENFCEFILMNLSYIRKHKNCPDDIIEAISTLIYASARCGDFPELKLVRELFTERYGQSFAMAAVELHPGTLVNSQMKEKLSTMPVSDDEKKRLINEMARDCFRPAILALEYCPDWHQKQVLDNRVQTFCERTEGAIIQDSNAEELEREVTRVDSSLTSSNSLSTQCHSTSACYLVDQSSPCFLEMIVQKELGEASKDPELPSSGLLTFSSWKAKECQSTGLNEAAILEDKLDGDNDASSSERLPPFSDETIVYLDDIVEIQNSATKDGDLQDHRLFKFKSPLPTKKQDVEDGYNNQIFEEHDENQTKKSHLERSSKSRNGSRKALRRRATCREMQSIRDIEGARYYGQPAKSSYAHKHASKGQRKQKLMKCCCLSCHSCWLTSEMENCSLEQPCYVYSDSIIDDFDVVISEEKRVESYFLRSPAHNHLETTVVYDVFIFSHLQPEENKETNEKPEEFCAMGKYECSLGSYEKENNSTKYMKAADLPLQQSQDSRKDEILHSISCPNKYPSHVHPKLPDYDEIAAKFIALKREHLQKKHHQCGN